jgi:hypothetical protein
MTDKDIATLRRELLEASVTDTEGTIRATDTKASIALVLHGLLFSGVVGVTKDLGDRYSETGSLQKVLVVGCLIIVALAFASSVMQLLRCVAPAPAHAIPHTHGRSRGLFFITARRTGRFSWHMPSAEELERRLHKTGVDHIEQEWLAEALKVAGIRERKTRLIKSGLALLAVEVLAVVVYLALIGVSAA